MNWQKVIDAMIEKSEEYEKAGKGFMALNPGIGAKHQARATVLREQAGFLQAGIEQ